MINKIKTKAVIIFLKRHKISFIFIGFLILMVLGCFEKPYHDYQRNIYGENEIYTCPRTSTQHTIWTKDTPYEINSLALSDDGFYIFVGCYDNIVLLFNNTSSEPVWTRNTGSPVIAVSMSPNGTYCIAGCNNGRVMLFNTNSSNPLWDYFVGNKITSLDFSINNKYFVVGSNDAYIHLFNLTGHLWSFKTEGFTILSVDISFNANTIAAVAYQNSIIGHIYVLNRTGDLLWSNQSLEISYARVTSDGNYICGAGIRYGYMFNRNSSTLKWKRIIGDYFYGLYAFYGMEMSRSGKTIVFANLGSLYTLTRVLICDFNGSIIESHSYSWGTYYWNAAVSGNGRYVSHTNSLYSVIIRKRISDISFTGAGSYDLGELISTQAYNYNGSYLVLGGLYGRITLLYNNIKLSSFKLTTDADTPDINGNFTLYWDDPGNADNFTIYTHNSFITQINDTLGTLDITTSRSFSIFNLSNGVYYYLILAQNEKYNLSSNCIKVEVRTPYEDEDEGDDKVIFGYSLYSLFCTLSIVSLIFVKIRKKITQ